MLWYKAWLETRLRFVLSLAGILVLCAWKQVYRSLDVVIPTTPVRYYYGLAHSANGTLCVLWVAAVTLLAMGGLMRERANGASLLTLALPVSRVRLVWVRIAMLCMEAAALMFAPWIAVILIIGVGAKPQLLAQAWFHIVLLAGGGSVFVAIPILASSVFEGEYTAPAVSFGIALAMSLGLSPVFDAWNPSVLITGSRYFDRATGMLIEPLPWTQVAISALFAAALIGIAVKAVQRRDF
jgi:ABC-type transport system involved in multi-copper enzyme maturation permease subunit